MATTNLAITSSARPVASPSTTVSRRSVLRPSVRVALWACRALTLVPAVFLGPELLSAVQDRPGAVANLVTSSNDVFGNGALLLFFLMLTVTPLNAICGWHWHRILRRDFGRAMFVYACSDLIVAATLTGTRFPGGLMARVGGHGFLLSGTLSTLLVVPVMATSNRAAQKWLGQHWKAVHRIVYVTWATIAVHLAFLFAFRTFFIDFLVVSAPLALLRIGGIERWCVRGRKTGTDRVARTVLTVALLGVFSVGFTPFLIEFAHVGVGAISQHPH